jgi:hypothetical protein
MERMREEVSGAVDAAYMERRTSQGWRLAAVEWVREDRARPARQEAPYGLRVCGDCLHLEENPEEKAVLTRMMQLIALDEPLSKVADELNRQGLRTRRGLLWSPVDIFQLLPRLIDCGPSILASREWAALKR